MIEIKVWQIVDNKLELIKTIMVKTERKETEDLEKWIKSNPSILGQDILIIGKEIPTKSGRIDLLGIDRSGDLIIIELKRGKIPREAISQAIDYASDVASWNKDKLNEICTKYTGLELEDYLNEKFEDINLENLPINKTQRILFIEFSIKESL
jgi:RecB family endonuclease NucS